MPWSVILTEVRRNTTGCVPFSRPAIFATPVGFRAAHFAYAIEKGVHAFLEKPISIDGPSTKRIIELAAKADAKNLKVGVGLMCRHSEARRELFWQAKRFHSFLWASGGVFSDFYVHHVDEVCWMKNAWPVKAEATGGRHFCGKLDDQNFDSYGVEWTFADGTKFFYSGRTMKDCEQKFGVGEQWVFHRRECPDHALSSPSACLMSASGTSPAILCAATLCARTALRDPRRKRPHQSRPLRDA